VPLTSSSSTMSQYKSTVRSQQGTSKSSPYHEKATQLHELFPDLPVDGKHGFALSATTRRLTFSRFSTFRDRNASYRSKWRRSASGCKNY